VPVIKKEDIEDYIGKALGVSEWFDVTQERINAFADVTFDHQYIHCDPEKAKNTPFGTTIAHAFYSLALLSHLEAGPAVTLAGRQLRLNYGFNKIRFTTPVPSNKRVRAHFRLLDISEKKAGHFLLTHEVTLEVDGQDNPAMVAEWLTMDLVATDEHEYTSGDGQNSHIESETTR